MASDGPQNGASTAACRAAEFGLCDLCVVEPYRFTRERLCEAGLSGAQLDEAPKALPITLVGQFAHGLVLQPTPPAIPVQSEIQLNAIAQPLVLRSAPEHNPRMRRHLAHAKAIKTVLQQRRYWT